jgi:hypothetical protein
MSDARKPDAILYQAADKVGVDTYGRAKTIQDRFGPILGSSNVYSHDVPHAGILCVPRLDHDANSYLTPGRTGRYQWVPQADGTQYGYLVAQGGAPKPEAPASA